MASQTEDVIMTAEHTTTTNNKSTQRRITSRNPQWTYFKLQLIPHSNHPIKNFTIDPLTARAHLSSALSQFLGLMGTSIGIDILKIENPSSSSTVQQQQSAKRPIIEFPNVWIRVPKDDGAAVLAALSSWVGSLSSSAAAAAAAAGDVSEDGDGGVAWRVCAKGNYLNAIVHGSGKEVFDP
ncbi:conserved hypothetical protein [Talaromyces stipitatus ATCC 10500]|uniref:Ribonucleases P/MRP subunit Pop8-like domain-containing protein n=1 Tax=Talaromyces stipitatus (strain ATCC 10500 / CBS 375.48 / QM 6759 / NRRL 1006) TaxID=441959 RepID=B8MBS6_TALSN|nr:uncharacterized protein TSTA_119690 [Talaromyces stipitatus ATCC 10500]EED18209.1 conserved hypothetical protein [Talaromyces stipitatus ATCC 10500]